MLLRQCSPIQSDPFFNTIIIRKGKRKDEEMTRGQGGVCERVREVFGSSRGCAPEQGALTQNYLCVRRLRGSLVVHPRGHHRAAGCACFIFSGHFIKCVLSSRLLWDSAALRGSNQMPSAYPMCAQPTSDLF